MYAVIGVLKKPSTVDTEAFREWWFDRHVPHVLEIPGLRRYEIYPLDSGFDLATGQWSEKPSADGVAVLWFDDKETAHGAFGTEEGEADRRHFRDWSMEALTFGGSVMVKRALNPDASSD